MWAWRLHASLPRTATSLEAADWLKVLRWEEVELPKLPEGWARVRLLAAALNRRDLWITLGLYPGIQYPAILGSDGCGEVVAIGSGVPSEWLGQRVLLNPSLNWGQDERVQGERYHILGMPSWGTLAEYVDVPAENLYPMPAYLSPVEAAAIPLAGLTAYRAVFVQGGLQPGEKVLIPGIGGGVAVWALQLAVAAGAEVWVASSRPEKIETAHRLGAKGGILYTEKNWAENLLQRAGSFDLIVDGVGGEVFSAYQLLLAPAGRVVIYGATRGNPPSFDLRRLFWRQNRIIGSTMGSPRNFSDLLHFLTQHQIRPLIEHTYPLTALPQALARLWRGDQMGKIILHPV